MSWSLGEVRALSVKATRGAGFPWGLAEEAGYAVVWLQARKVDGCAALADYLSFIATSTNSDSDCPIRRGAALSRDDVLRERRRVEDGEEEHGDELADVVDHRDHAVEDKEARRVRVQTATPENRPQQQQQQLASRQTPSMSSLAGSLVHGFQ